MYIEGLKCIAAYQGYSPDDIDTMLKSGISPDEIEEYALQMAEMTKPSRYFLPQSLKHNYVFFTTQLSKAD